MKDIKGEILVIGIGNNGRSDDGLGWALIDKIEERFPELNTVHRYQLQIEDAELISHFKTVIFVDSTVEFFTKGYEWKALEPETMTSFTSHALQPGVVLGLCDVIYDYQPVAFQMAISGEEWSLCNELSQLGNQHLQMAYNSIIQKIPCLISLQKVS